MAQLPDENVIALPQAGSARRPSSIEVIGYARGAAAVGSAYETLGKGVTSAMHDVGAVLKAQQEADAKLETARANGKATSELLDLGNSIERATDPNGLEESTRQRAEEIVANARTEIKDSRRGGQFTLGTQESVQRLVNAAKNQQFGLTRDARMASDMATMRKLGDDAIASGEEGAHEKVIPSVHGYIDAWVRNGYVDQTRAFELKSNWARDFAAGKLTALPPDERIEALKGGTATRHGPLADMLPRNVLEQMRITAGREFTQGKVKASYDTLGETQRTLTEASNGLVPLPPHENIESNPNLLPAEKSRALALYDIAAGDVTALKEFNASIDDPEGREFDPHDPATRVLANRAYASRKRTPEALRRIVERTKVLPDDAAVALQDALDSGSIDRVQHAMQLLAEMPDRAFVSLKGGRMLAEARETYQAKFTVWGSPSRAAQDYISERTADVAMPALQQQKRETMNKRLEAVTPEAMQAYLQPAGGDWSAAAYVVGNSNAERERLLHQFRDVVREVYLEQRSSDIDEAMAKAALRFKTTFGLSTTHGPDPTDPKQKWGEQRLVRFAPSAWQGYAAGDKNSVLVPDEVDGLFKEAVAEYIESRMRDPSGWRAPRDKIILRPVDFTRTEEPFMTANPARPPKYLVAYEDERGLIQTVGIWGATPQVLREIKSRRKAAGFTTSDAAENANIDALAQRPMFQDF